MKTRDLLFLTTACGLAIAAAPSRAQSSGDAAAQAADAAEDEAPAELVITGSRIDRAGFDAPTPTTVIGATQFGGDVGESEGLKGILMMLAFVNVFFGVFNMLPLLPFDGGHVAIATYERIRSRGNRRYQADASKMVPVAVAVTVLMLALFLAGSYLDIAKPL